MLRRIYRSLTSAHIRETPATPQPYGWRLVTMPPLTHTIDPMQAATRERAGTTVAARFKLRHRKCVSYYRGSRLAGAPVFGGGRVSQRASLALWHHVGIATYFLYFAHGALRAHFAIDDPMNLGIYWQRGLAASLSGRGVAVAHFVPADGRGVLSADL